MTARSLDPDGPARLLRKDDVQRVLSALAAPGEETRLVGGCIRDALLGRLSDDLDLATTLTPHTILSLAAKAGLRAIPTGFEHGTVTILAGGTAFEVTTLREDIETDGRHAVVRFGRDFVRDAERRDFTINALSVDAAGALHDTTGGIADLIAGKLRFIGDAATRIREDALRLLRFFRFHARYGMGAMDDAGLDACRAARDAVDHLSRERVRAEFMKLLVAPGAVAAIQEMDGIGVLERVIGGPYDLGKLARSIDALPHLSDIDRLAALAIRTPQDAVWVQEALRLSKAEGAALRAYGEARVVLSHRAEIDAGAMRALIAEHDAGPIERVLASSDVGEGPRLDDEARTVLDAVLAGSAPRPVFPLTGADLVALGVEPGPAVGLGLAAARTRWLEWGCPDDHEPLLASALKAAEGA